MAAGTALAAITTECVAARAITYTATRYIPIGRSHHGGHHDGKNNHNNGQQHGYSRKGVHDLERFGIKQLESDTRHPEDVYLSQKFTEIDTALVPHGGICYERGCKSGTRYALAHIYVFGKHLTKTTYSLVDPARKAHIEGAWGELLEGKLTTAYAAGGKEGCHSVIYSLLRGSER